MSGTNTNTVATANLTAWDPRLSGALKTDGKAADDAKLKKACQEMEGVFLNMLLKSMRATVTKTETGGSTMQAETMQSMFDMEMTRHLAAAGGVGIADMMYRNLTRSAAATATSPTATRCRNRSRWCCGAPTT